MIVHKSTQDKFMGVLESVAGIVARRHSLPILASVLIRGGNKTEISNGMPEHAGGDAAAVDAGDNSTGADGAPEVAGDDDDGGDGDGDPDRRSSHTKPSSRGKLRNVTATADAPPSPHSLLWALPAVTNSVAICRSQLYLLIQRGEFPEPIKLGRSSRWLASEVHAWVHQKAATRVNTLKAG